jgi:hypothetical protein
LADVDETLSLEVVDETKLGSSLEEVEDSSPVGAAEGDTSAKSVLVDRSVEEVGIGSFSERTDVVSLSSGSVPISMLLVVVLVDSVKVDGVSCAKLEVSETVMDFS